MLYRILRQLFFSKRGRKFIDVPDRILEETIRGRRAYMDAQMDDIEAALELDARVWFRDFIGKSIIAWIALGISIASFFLTASMKISESSNNHKRENEKAQNVQPKEEPKPK